MLLGAGYVGFTNGLAFIKNMQVPEDIESSGDMMDFLGDIWSESDMKETMMDVIPEEQVGKVINSVNDLFTDTTKSMALWAEFSVNYIKDLPQTLREALSKNDQEKINTRNAEGLHKLQNTLRELTKNDPDTYTAFL